MQGIGMRICSERRQGKWERARVHGRVWAHRGRGYGMKAAWKKWGRSTEMGVVSTKWRGLEYAGGPERIEGERDVAPHVHIHRAERVV